jgi:hypothetical protein
MFLIKLDVIKVNTKRFKRAAKRLFPKKSHGTRAFTLGDYNNLPKN